MSIVRPSRYELAAYGRYLFGVPSTGVRALIFGQGRTGTTLLEQLLCSSGHFTPNGEVLRDRPHVLFRNALLEGLARKHPHENFICHVMPWHLGWDRRNAGASPIYLRQAGAPVADLRRFLTTLSSRGWRIIHLSRQNKLRHCLSHQVARERGGFHKFDDQPEEFRIVVDRDEFSARLAGRIECDRRERAALASIPHLELHYETDLESPHVHQDTINRVLDHLGLERRPVETKLRKINNRPIAEIVGNYDQFAAWACELGAAEWLD